MSKEKLFHVGVKALIRNEEGKVLILDVDTTHFTIEKIEHSDLPGGRINKNETPEQALKREMLEETGITTLLATKFLTAIVSNMEIPISDTERVGLVLMIYEVTVPPDSAVSISPEHTNYEWVSPAEARKRLSYKYTVDFTDLLT